MSTPTSPASPTLRALRHQNRLLGTALLATLALLGLSATDATKPKKVEASELVLIDGDDEVRARLAMVDGAPAFVLLDQEGRERSRLALDEAGWASLSMTNARGHNRAIVKTAEDHSFFYALDRTGRGGAVIGSYERGSDVTIYDNNPKIPQVRGRFEVKQTQDGSRPTVLTLWDEEHKTKVRMSSADD